MIVDADPVSLLVELIRAPSVTPDAGAALDVLERHLAPAGFSVDRLLFEEAGAAPVENMFAAIGTGERHLTFAGHVDVVPPGPESRWRHPPFAAEIVDGVLYGRGAVDMKGGLAAMIAAALRFVGKRGKDFGGRLSFLITGDEEGVGGQRHREAARLGGGARRTFLRCARRRADQRARARRPDQDRPPRQLLRHAHRRGHSRATPPIRSWRTIRSAG